jgi:hypothetical protein
MEADIASSSSALMAMPIELCSSSGLQASEYAAIKRLVFASHSSRNEDELNPEFICSLFHFLFAMRTEQVPERHNGSALDSGTETVKIVAVDKRARPSIGLVGKDQFAIPDGLLQSREYSSQRSVLPFQRETFLPAASTLAIAVRHFLGSLWNNHSTPSAKPDTGSGRSDARVHCERDVKQAVTLL